MRLWPASASRRSSVSSSVRSATRAAASTVQPSAKTDNASTNSSSTSSRSPKLHSTVARRVRWRSGRSTGPVPSASRTCSSRASSAAGEQPRAGRGELDRQRQPVETSADLHHGGGVRVVDGEVVTHGPRPLDEEAHGGERGELSERRRLGERRHRQRRDGVLALGAKAQRGAAGGEDRDAGARDEELIELGRHAGHLLEIVEDEQRRGLLEALDQGVERRARALDRRAESGGDTWQHQRRIGDRRQRHELRAAPGPIERGADRDRQSGLADPTRPVSVTNRTSADVSSDDSSAMSSSRPTNEVDGVGNERRGGRSSVVAGAAERAAGAAVTNRSLSSSARSSPTSRPSSRAWRTIGRSRRPPTGCRRSSPPTGVPAPEPAT